MTWPATSARPYRTGPTTSPTTMPPSSAIVVAEYEAAQQPKNFPGDGPGGSGVTAPRDDEYERRL